MRIACWWVAPRARARCVDVGGPGVVVAAGVGERADRRFGGGGRRPSGSGRVWICRIRRRPGLGRRRRRARLRWGSGRGSRRSRLSIAAAQTTLTWDRRTASGRSRRRGGRVRPARISLVSSLMLRDDRLERGDERENDLAARFGLERGGAAVGGSAQPAEQLARWSCGRSSAGARGSARCAARRGRRASAGRGIALEEGERDRAVDVGEDVTRHRARSTPAERAARWRARRADATRSSRARESARSALVASVSGISTRKRCASVRGQLGQHEGIEAVALAAGSAEPRTHARRPGWDG